MVFEIGDWVTPNEEYCKLFVSPIKIGDVYRVMEYDKGKNVPGIRIATDNGMYPKDSSSMLVARYWKKVVNPQDVFKHL